MEVSAELTELWRAAFGSYGAMVESGTDVLVVEALANFRAPARFDDELDLSMTIARLGKSPPVMPSIGSRRRPETCRSPAFAAPARSQPTLRASIAASA